MNQDAEDESRRETLQAAANTILETGLEAPNKIDAEYLFDYTYLWLEFEAHLRGGDLKKNNNGFWEIIVKRGSKPFMNDQGIKDVMAVLKASVNIIGGSTIYGTEENQSDGERRILQWCERFTEDVAEMLFINQIKYDLDDAKYMLLVTIIAQAFESNLRKSLGGRALTLALQGKRVIESRQFQDARSNQPGIISRLLPKI